MGRSTDADAGDLKEPAVVRGVYGYLGLHARLSRPNKRRRQGAAPDG
jgi:hypothetical protein